MPDHQPENATAFDTPDGVLAYARDRRRASWLAEADQMQAAAAWAAMHSGDSVVAEADWMDSAIPIAGAGAPEVSELAVAEWAAALGRSTDSGRKYLGEVIECRYRLPRVWELLTEGRLEPWRARWIADRTMSL